MGDLRDAIITNINKQIFVCGFCVLLSVSVICFNANLIKQHVNLIWYITFEMQGFLLWKYQKFSEYLAIHFVTEWTRMGFVVVPTAKYFRSAPSCHLLNLSKEQEASR